MYVDEKRHYVLPARTKPTSQDILYEAANIIERDGFDPSGRLDRPPCVIQAMSRASVSLYSWDEHFSERDRLYEEALLRLRKWIGKPKRISRMWFWPSPIEWAQNQTQQSVANALRQAAE